ncbi:MAG TPA: cation:proton antiporter [Acidobacteriaceae bacterium]|nr:cation:proton antiporter [Acidobacteriaceae bacterium]
MSSLALFLLQIAVIVLVTGMCGVLLGKLGQPRVVGEMLGGILLGRSVFGYAMPHLIANLFPLGSLHDLSLVSELGMVLYLFLEGMNLDFESVWKQRQTAMKISLLSMVIPFGLGCGLGVVMYRNFHGTSANFAAFLLFVGVGLSTTAFPVLARMLRDNGTGDAKLNMLALVCAAIADVLGWILLAIALMIDSANSTVWILLLKMFLLVAFGVFLLGVVRPLLARLVRWKGAPNISQVLLAVFLVFILACAFITERLGVHALFGAFLAGMCVPRLHHWHRQLERTIHPLVSVLLLPVFFAVTGIHTEFRDLGGKNVFLWFVVLLTVAIAGKVGGTYYGARKSNLPPRESMLLGFLMNTRGLIDLVVVNLALQAGAIDTQLFTILVLVALITTAMTAPALKFLRKKPEVPTPVAATG